MDTVQWPKDWQPGYDWSIPLGSALAHRVRKKLALVLKTSCQDTHCFPLCCVWDWSCRKRPLMSPISPGPQRDGRRWSVVPVHGGPTLWLLELNGFGFVSLFSNINLVWWSQFVEESDLFLEENDWSLVQF